MGPLTLVHIVAGSAALAGGFAALALRKGSGAHRRAGTVFLAAMLVMALTGSAIAFALPERATGLIGLITAYLVVTGWSAARRRDGSVGPVERAALPVSALFAAAQFTLGLMASAAPGGRLDALPAPAIYPFALVAAIGAVGDLRLLRRGALSPRQRMARHVWRMCAALFIAAASFFMGQQDEFPKALQGLALWYLPPLIVLGAMIYWLARPRFPAVRARSADLHPAPPG